MRDPELGDLAACTACTACGPGLATYPDDAVDLVAMHSSWSQRVANAYDEDAGGGTAPPART